MSGLFKKHFWAVNLSALALLAWLSALTVNEVTEGMLFVAPASPNVSLAESGQAAAAKRGRVPGDEDARDNLVERQVFDLNPMEDDITASSEESEEKKEEIKPSGDGELEESDLPIDLMGTLVSPDPQQSMATLSIDGENKIGWIGSEFMEGKAKIVTIAPRHIIIQEGVAMTVVKLWTERAKAGPKGAKGGKGPKRRGKSASPSRDKKKPKKEKSKSERPGRKDYSKGVKKTGPYDYQIDRGMLDEQLKDLSELGRQARVVPNYRNGKYEGFKLVGVRPGSLYRSIGVRSGDVIKSINGKAIDSPNKALDLFEQLKNSSSINLEIERRGQPKQLNYSIK